MPSFCLSYAYKKAYKLPYAWLATLDETVKLILYLQIIIKIFLIFVTNVGKHPSMSLKALQKNIGKEQLKKQGNKENHGTLQNYSF